MSQIAKLRSTELEFEGHFFPLRDGIKNADQSCFISLHEKCSQSLEFCRLFAQPKYRGLEIIGDILYVCGQIALEEPEPDPGEARLSRREKYTQRNMSLRDAFKPTGPSRKYFNSSTWRSSTGSIVRRTSMSGLWGSQIGESTHGSVLGVTADDSGQDYHVDIWKHEGLSYPRVLDEVHWCVSILTYIMRVNSARDSALARSPHALDGIGMALRLSDPRIKRAALRCFVVAGRDHQNIQPMCKNGGLDSIVDASCADDADMCLLGIKALGVLARLGSYQSELVAKMDLSSVVAMCEAPIEEEQESKVDHDIRCASVVFMSRVIKENPMHTQEMADSKLVLESILSLINVNLDGETVEAALSSLADLACIEGFDEKFDDITRSSADRSEFFAQLIGIIRLCSGIEAEETHGTSDLSQWGGAFRSFFGLAQGSDTFPIISGCLRVLGTLTMPENHHSDFFRRNALCLVNAKAMRSSFSEILACVYDLDSEISRLAIAVIHNCAVLCPLHLLAYSSDFSSFSLKRIDLHELLTHSPVFALSYAILRGLEDDVRLKVGILAMGILAKYIDGQQQIRDVFICTGSGGPARKYIKSHDPRYKTDSTGRSSNREWFAQQMRTTGDDFSLVKVIVSFLSLDQETMPGASISMEMRTSMLSLCAALASYEVLYIEHLLLKDQLRSRSLTVSKENELYSRDALAKLLRDECMHMDDQFYNDTIMTQFSTALPYGTSKMTVVRSQLDVFEGSDIPRETLQDESIGSNPLLKTGTLKGILVCLSTLGDSSLSRIRNPQTRKAGLSMRASGLHYLAMACHLSPSVCRSLGANPVLYTAVIDYMQRCGMDEAVINRHL